MIKLRDYQQKVMDSLRDMKEPIFMSIPLGIGIAYSRTRLIPQEITFEEVAKRFGLTIAAGRNLFDDFSGPPYDNRVWGLHCWTYWDHVRSTKYKRTILQNFCLHLLYPFHWSRYAE